MANLNYMILGFSVIFGVLIVHIASFVVRSHSLNNDLAMLHELDKKPPKKKPAPKKSKRR